MRFFYGYYNCLNIVIFNVSIYLNHFQNEKTNYFRRKTVHKMLGLCFYAHSKCRKLQNSAKMLFFCNSRVFIFYHVRKLKIFSEVFENDYTRQFQWKHNIILEKSGHHSEKVFDNKANVRTMQKGNELPYYSLGNLRLWSYQNSNYSAR